MERELLNLFTAVRKAADAAAANNVSPDGSRCIDALKKLQSFNINKDLLVSAMLRPLKQQESAKITIPASAQNGGVQVSRKRIRERLVAALSQVAAEVGDESLRREVKANCDPLRVASSVEHAMFEKINKPDNQKNKAMRSILFNLGDPKNPDLRRRVLIGEITAERLVNMSHTEMASDAMKAKNRQIEERALAKCETGRSSADDVATTDQFRCGERQTVYHQMQTRSADEPMTTYVTCVNCDHHGKFC